MNFNILFNHCTTLTHMGLPSTALSTTPDKTANINGF